MRFEPADENGRNGNELPVSELNGHSKALSKVAVFQVFETHLAILE